MRGNEVTEVLRPFVARYTAVSAETGLAQDGYFRVDGGPTKGQAKQCRADVPWTLGAEKALQELVSRVEEATNEHAWVGVRAMPRGSKHPAKTEWFEGDPDGTEPESPMPTGANACAEALARLALQQDRRIADLVGRLEFCYQDRVVLEAKNAAYAGYLKGIEESGDSQAMAKAIETFGAAVGPALAAAVPDILAVAMGTPTKGAVPPRPPPPPPADGAAPVDGADHRPVPDGALGVVRLEVQAILASADRMRAAVAADPSAMAALPAELEPLRELVTQLSAVFGLGAA